MNKVLKTSRNQVSRNVQRLSNSGETDVLVYGCGRFVHEMATKAGGTACKGLWAWFDPYVEGFGFLASRAYGNVILDNVLNVIEDNKELEETLEDAWHKVESKGSLWVNIYEGDKKGLGAFTGGRCQRNEKIKEYIWAFRGLNHLQSRETINGGFRITKA